MSDLEPILTLPIQGGDVYAMSVHVEAIQNQRIPVFSMSNEWTSFEGVLHEQAQKLLGKWPVYVARFTNSNLAIRSFTGFRVFARCHRLTPGTPNQIEYAILVWHESKISMPMSFPMREHDDIPWSRIAELVDF